MNTNVAERLSEDRLKKSIKKLQEWRKINKKLPEKDSPSLKERGWFHFIRCYRNRSGILMDLYQEMMENQEKVITSIT